MRSELTIDDEDCDAFLLAISPDNYGGINAECVDGKIRITIEEKKYGTVFSLLDDMIRSYEVFEKIRNMIRSLTAPR
ncbi:hypothetical protein [Thermoplasma sp.]|uniref:hypothetical protein n=1 Tax=Thermoplasma sp. TaxID=1973142 RepID=UPI001279CE6F|nr:hypothetical protein [Thermoplasma sp.]KAA8923174.1 MAG: hypothetical protein F6Q11_01450 [Thermoplasma sp.]